MTAEDSSSRHLGGIQNVFKRVRLSSTYWRNYMMAVGRSGTRIITAGLSLTKMVMRFLSGLQIRYSRRGSDITKQSRTELEFLPAAAEILDTPPSPIRVVIALAICTLIACVFAISWFGQVDIYAVAPGRIQPVGRSKVLQPFHAGTVRRIFIQEGSSVRRGAVLIELDPTEANADRASAYSHVGSLSAEIARRRLALAVVKSGNFGAIPPIPFPGEIDRTFRGRETEVLLADLATLSTSVAMLEAKIGESLTRRRALENVLASEVHTIDTLRRRVQIRSDLQNQGWESETNVLDATETLQREITTQTTDQGQILQIDASIASLREQKEQTIAQFVSDYSRALEKGENDLDSASQDLIKAGEQARYTQLKAPIDGTVQQLTVTTPGQVVSPGQQLMTIVPRGTTLEIEALVQSQDIGFVRVGQSTVVKVDAFPFTRYGTISGVVTHVSRDSLESGQAQSEEDTQQKFVTPIQSAASPTPQTQQLVFPVTISLNRDDMIIDGQPMPLSPGMSVTVEIATGSQRAIQFILAPFIQVQSEALRER